MVKGKIFIISIIMLAIMAACSSSPGEKMQGGANKKELTFLSNFPSDTLDPHLNFTPLRAGTVETLVKINEDLEMEPWLATEWKSEEEGKTWIFTIREGVTFQNGKPVDAAAVKASLERNIQVSDAIKTALKIDGIEADGQTLTVHLEQTVPQFPSELVHPNTAIIDINEENVEQNPVGTGAFKVLSFESGSKLVVERYDDYWGGKAKLDQVTLTFNDDANARTLALQSGDADIVYRPAVESLEGLVSDDSIKTDIVPGFRTHLLIYNTNDSNMSDLNMRKAIDALIDRKEIANSILAGQATVANGPFLPEFPFALSYKQKEFDLALAKQYFEAAGAELKDGKVLKDGKPLSLKLITYSFRPELPLMAQLLQSNAKELGISIEIQVVENADEYLSSNNDWQFATFSFITAPRGDASYFLNSMYMDGGAFAFSEIANEDLVNKMEEFNRTIDEIKRNELAKEAGKIIDEEYLHSFIVHVNNFVAYRDYVENWITSKSEYYMITKDLGVK